LRLYVDCSPLDASVAVIGAAVVVGIIVAHVTLGDAVRGS
jgi:hypothetical protein